MTQVHEPGPDKARRHYQRAEAYRELAQELLEQSSRATATRSPILADSAGAPLYEAAKQCVNAVANLHGRDPQENHAKIAEIRRIIADNQTSVDLQDGAHSAWELHIHADQGNLSPEGFRERFTLTIAFIAEMQAIYRTLANAG